MRCIKPRSVIQYAMQSMALGLVCITTHASARTYTFDPVMLGGGKDAVDMALFNQGGQLPGSYHVEVLLGGERVDTREIVFRLDKNLQGEPVLLPCLSVTQLSRYGVRVEDYPDLTANKSASEACADISAIPQASTDFLFYNQQLILNIPQAALRPALRGIAPQELWDEGITAALMNYRANTSRTEYRGTSRSHTDAQFVQLEPGLNLGPWRLRNLTTWQKTGENAGKWQTPYTYAERGVNTLKSRLTLGERYTPSDIFDSVPFSGVMLGSDEAMVPYHQREFGPVVRGIARTQARVEVKQNGFTIYDATVSPGPFILTDLSPSSSGGNLEVTVWETDGMPQVFTVVYQTPAIALREGYLKYNSMFGQYRSSDAAIKKAAIGQATLMVGLPYGLTVYGGAQGAEHYQSTLLGLGASLGQWGALSLDSNLMWGQRQGQESQHGTAWRTRYSKVAEATNTRMNLSHTYYSAPGYSSLPDVLDTYRGDDRRNGWKIVSNNDRAKSVSTVSLSQSLGNWGSLSLNGSRQRYWDRAGHNDAVGASYNVGIRTVSLSLNWSKIQRINRSGQRQDDAIISMMISFPLGGSVRSNYQLVSPSSSGDTHQLGLSGQAMERQFNWSVNQRYRPEDSRGDRDSSALQLSWFGGYGQVNANYSYSTNLRQMGASVYGGMVVHSHGVTLGQPLSDTVALVAAPGAAKVPVAGWPGVKTDFRGYTTRAYLTPYQENNISLDPSHLSAQAEINQTDIRVVPTKGAVIPARFFTQIGGRALMTLTRADGKPLPFGAMVTQEEAKSPRAIGVVDNNGVVFLSGLPAQGRLLVQWGQDQQQQCHVSYRLPKVSGPAGIFELSGQCQ